MSVSEPIRNNKDVTALLDYYRKRDEYRNYCFLGFGFFTALKVSDLIKIKWRDVYDFALDMFKVHIIIEKRGENRTIGLYLNKHLERIIHGYKEWLESSGSHLITPEQFLFKSRKGDNNHITRQHAHRIVQAAAESAGVSGVISCESMRKTFGYNAHKLGISTDIIMDMYSKKTYEAAKRYMGIEHEDFISQDERDTAHKLISSQIMDN